MAPNLREAGFDLIPTDEPLAPRRSRGLRQLRARAAHRSVASALALVALGAAVGALAVSLGASRGGAPRSLPLKGAVRLDLEGGQAARESFPEPTASGVDSTSGDKRSGTTKKAEETSMSAAVKEVGGKKTLADKDGLLGEVDRATPKKPAASGSASTTGESSGVSNKAGETQATRPLNASTVETISAAEGGGGQSKAKAALARMETQEHAAMRTAAERSGADWSGPDGANLKAPNDNGRRRRRPIDPASDGGTEAEVHMSAAVKEAGGKELVADKDGLSDEVVAQKFATKTPADKKLGNKMPGDRNLVDDRVTTKETADNGDASTSGDKKTGTTKKTMETSLSAAVREAGGKELFADEKGPSDEVAEQKLATGKPADKNLGHKMPGDLVDDRASTKKLADSGVASTSGDESSGASNKTWEQQTKHPLNSVKDDSAPSISAVSSPLATGVSTSAVVANPAANDETSELEQRPLVVAAESAAKAALAQMETQAQAAMRTAAERAGADWRGPDGANLKAPPCATEGLTYVPLDMEGTAVERAPDADACQARCAGLTGCVHFTFFLNVEGGGRCHVAGEGSAAAPGIFGAVAGPRSCWDTEAEVHVRK